MWFEFVLAGLATYRLTRLVTADRIMDWFRAAVEARSGWFGYLVTCDWCLSIWLAPWVAAVTVLWSDNRLVLVVLLWLALSAVTGLLAVAERKLDT